MRPLCRFLLLCLMAIALPVQGFAAAGMQHCGPMHDRMQATMLAQSVHHDDGHAHHHDAAVAPVVDDGAGASDHAPQAAKSNAVVKCSACAACCVALGLLSGALQLPQPLAEGLQPQLSSVEDAAFLTGGPERPPRTVLA